MFLEAFNDRASCFDFDLEDGTAVLSKCNNDVFSGIGANNESGFSGIYILDEKLYLFVGEKSIDVTGDDVDYKYRHDDSGVTRFTVIKSGSVCVDLFYPCWRVKGGLEPVGFGIADDDDEDFFAYVKLMLEADNRKLHLLKKYST